MTEPKTTTEACRAHGFHSPRPNYSELHHILPMSWGGPDVADNRIAICPTGHANVHRLLDALRRGGDVDLRGWGPGERALGMRGFEEWRNETKGADDGRGKAGDEGRG